ncbi:hypothetical protein [Paracoccus sp. ME4]|uniref:secretion/conjugation apparatus DotM-related subunit n=1 Tax=Paracoccus sp. ME4 TaxID=3138066 RepID=UPI00398A7185
MAANGQGGAQGDNDQEFMKMCIIGIIMVVLAIWFISTQRYRINAMIGAVTWIHVLPFALAARHADFLNDIPFLGRWLFVQADAALGFLEQGGYALMSAENRNATLMSGGRCAAFIYGGIFGWIALNGKEFRVDQKYRLSHSLETMIWAQSDIWMTSRLARHVNPLDLEEVDARRLADHVSKRVAKGTKLPGKMLPRQIVTLTPGAWCRSLRPEEWLIGAGLAFDADHYKRMTAPDRNARTSDFDFTHTWENLQLEEISEMLSRQLRTPWTGAKDLRPCLRAIFAVMALFYDYKVDEGNELINDLAILNDANKGKGGTMDQALRAEAGMMARIDKVALGRPGQMLAAEGRNHAWVESVFPVLVAVSRKDRGVLPPAAFLWLKAEDRLMWYILNNVGNEAVMAEAAGAMAHARAEAQLGKPIRRPAVYQAARALLEDYLDITKERVEGRHRKEISRRTAGQQIALMRDDIYSEPAYEEWGDEKNAPERDEWGQVITKESVA